MRYRLLSVRPVSQHGAQQKMRAVPRFQRTYVAEHRLVVFVFVLEKFFHYLLQLSSSPLPHFSGTNGYKLVADTGSAEASDMRRRDGQFPVPVDHTAGVGC